MNPNYVKLDKDFTAKAMSNARDYELLKKIVELVHSIGIRICIEGIEKAEKAIEEILKHGINYAMNKFN